MANVGPLREWEAVTVLFRQREQDFDSPISSYLTDKRRTLLSKSHFPNLFTCLNRPIVEINIKEKKKH